MASHPLDALTTRAGIIRFPAYIPVTTFGDKYPLDDLIRPYLPRLAPAVMVSYHYAKKLTSRPRLPMLVDSGGFAALFADSTIIEANGLGTIRRGDGDSVEPTGVLEFQERVADVAFTLDFPIPPGTENLEAERRLALTIRNALWAIENKRRRDLPLYACVQGWDVESFSRCASAYERKAFEGVAIGGLVPRLTNRALVYEIVDSVRKRLPELPLHVFGAGHPEIVKELFARGVQSVDSSSYVKLAADGALWGNASHRLVDATPSERLQLALFNLATATGASLPLSAVPMFQSFGAERGIRGGYSVTRTKWPELLRSNQ